MANDFPVFPKIGYYLKFKEVYSTLDHFTLQPGTLSEVVGLSIEPDSGEYHKYILYLGLTNNRVIKFNYTVNHYKVSVIPSSKATKILYG